jgi:hypothetical protein
MKVFETAVTNSVITRYSVVCEMEVHSIYCFYSHTYTTLGAFTMTVTAIGDNGCSTTRIYNKKTNLILQVVIGPGAQQTYALLHRSAIYICQTGH